MWWGRTSVLFGLYESQIFESLAWNRIIPRVPFFWRQSTIIDLHWALRSTIITTAVQLDFIQCPFPNQTQFGLEKIHPKNASDFPNQFQFGLGRKNGILQDADSKPNSNWFGKNWWPLSTSWKFQTKFSLVWNNHWLLSTPWTFNQSQFYCSSQPSMVHWLSIPIFPCLFVPLW